MLRVSCRRSSSPSSPHPAKSNAISSLQCIADDHAVLPKDHILNMSPRPSYPFNQSAAHSGKTMHDQFSTWGYEKEPCHSFINPIPPPQSSDELLKEIALLEVNIMHLERHLLSLYRASFHQQVPSLSVEEQSSHLQSKIGSAKPTIPDELCYTIEPEIWKGGSSPKDGIFYAQNLAGSNGQPHPNVLKSASKKERKNANSGHRKLADHLGTSCIDAIPCCPDGLSEDIVRCISSIYCKLASPSLAQAGISVSSSSSLSSSSSFSPRNLSDSWSPYCNEDASEHSQFQGSKEEHGPDSAVIEVLKLCLDDDNFNFAARKLRDFRSLVKSLEKVDPKKMKREEKLAFWINIHNALVMHAYLAYGTQNCVRSASILKAAYNVGGHCINAYVIQSSILGIRSHYPAPWLRTLLSSGKMLKAGTTEHVFAIEYPEPLVHFALCSGAYTDPVVRVYRAMNIFHDLRLAKEEFIQANVYVHKKTKIYMPKIVCYYAKDMSLTMPGLLETVKGCLPESQRGAIRRCEKGRPDKFIYWVQQSSTFRYAIRREAAAGERLPV